jgi:trypsin-like peptidase/TIR domain-containing protein
VAAPPEPWIARLRDAREATVGMGLLFGPRHIVTCAHVVSEILGGRASDPRPPTGTLTVDFPFHPNEPAKAGPTEKWWPADESAKADIEDLCVLEMTGAAPAAEAWPLLGEAPPRAGSNVKSYGCPRGFGTRGVWSNNRLGDRLPGAWWQLEPQVGTPSRVRRGFSGAPVWDIQEDALAGLVVASHENEGFASLIPVEVLRRACADFVAPTREAALPPASDEPPDVFVSYNRRDQAAARDLVTRLDRTGLKVWFDERSLASGLPGRPA